MAKYRNLRIIDRKAAEALEKAGEGGDSKVAGLFRKSKNLFNKSTITVNKYPHPTTGQIMDNNKHDCSDFIPVTAGKTYTKNFVGHLAYYDSTDKFVSGISENALVDGVPFTIPTRVAKLRVSLNKSLGYTPDTCQLQEGMQVTGYEAYTDNVLDDRLASFPVKTLGRADIIQLYEQSKWFGKTWNVLGDSITAANKYQLFVSDRMKFLTVRTYGIGGTKIADTTGSDANAMVNRYATMDNNADLITVLGSTNDYGDDVPLGADNSRDKATFKGALRVLIEGLLVKYKGKRIVFMTLLPRDHGNQPDGKNANGNTTMDFANAIKQICYEYSIPVIDLHAKSGINKFNMDIYMPDKIHPNDDGYKLMANLIVSELLLV